MKDEQKRALSDAYEALSGTKPLEAVARVLREGWDTPAFLGAIAKRLDPTFEGEWDDFRLVLVSRDTLGPVNHRRREERLVMVTDVINAVWEARQDPNAIVSNVVADLCSKWSISPATVYFLASGT